MIALDTNVLVRFLVQDDPEQARIATTLMDQLTDAAPGFVGREVLVELVWVLERAYGYQRADIAAALDGVCDLAAADDMDGAVATAFALAEPGDTVLLAPACASFDMFTSFVDRGERFLAAVQRLAEGAS